MSSAIRQVAELRVVDDAFTYTMQPPEGGGDPNLWERVIQPVMANVEAQVFGEFFDALNAGKITQEQFDANLQDEVWRRVSRQVGLKYRRRKWKKT